MTEYISTPIYYVNDLPHIGHAYTSVAADVMARFRRLDGHSVYLMTGTDEHGQKVANSAEKMGKTPQEFADFYSGKFRKMSDDINMSYDDFLRTTEPRHKKAATALWNTLMQNGHIYLDNYAGWYSVRDEAFYAESELIDGKAPTGAPVEWVEEPSYFFNLSKWQDSLLLLYESNPDFIWRKQRMNEVVSFVKSGLRDLSVSRTTFSWGVPVPNDEKHVMYVWIEALSCYISTLGYPDADISQASYYHVMGKDIVRFHAVYWPALLMAAGLPLPKQIVAHGWWTNEGQKISKSLGNVINPYDLIEQLGLDQTRYMLLREVPFGNDGNYSKLSAVRRINAELANNIGNLSQRTLSFLYKNCGGVVPVANVEDEILDQSVELISKFKEHMYANEFSDAIEMIVQIGKLANAYIDEQAPWKLKNSDVEQMNHVLSVLVNMIKDIAILLLAFTPTLASDMLDILNIKLISRNYGNLGKVFDTEHQINEPKPIFPRLDEPSEV